MPSRDLRMAVALGLCTAFPAACNGGPAGPPGPMPPEIKQTRWDESARRTAGEATIRLTIYSDGSALVTDERPLALEGGPQVALWPGVAATTDPQAALLDVPGATTIRQRFRYDPAERSKLLQRYDGKEVQLFSPEASQTLTAILRVTPSGPLYKVGDRVYVDPPGKLILPGLDEASLVPTLEFMVVAPAPWTGSATASYVAGGMAWSSEYTLVTDAKQSSGRFSHWAAITNRSGARFQDADVTLVAGGAGRNRGPRPLPLGAERAYAGAPAAAPAPVDVPAERFAARYQYHLPERITLDRDTEDRVLLGEGREIAVTRSFRYERWVGIGPEPEPEQPTKAQVRLTIENSKANRLGVPLPAGRITVFTPGKQGTVAIAGETDLPDTPEDQKLILGLGEAFDVTVKRTQTDYREFEDAREAAYQIVVSNKMDEDVVVDVIQHIPGEWRMLEQSLAFERETASRIVFRPRVPAGGKATISFRVRINEPRKPQPR